MSNSSPSMMRRKRRAARRWRADSCADGRAAPARGRHPGRAAGKGPALLRAGVPGSSAYAHVGHQVLGLGHPELYAEACDSQPARPTWSGWKCVTSSRVNRRCGEQRGELLVPECARGIRVEPAVDQRPPVRFPQHPQVDVVQREGQRHAQPVRPGRVDGSRAGTSRSGNCRGGASRTGQRPS